MKDWRQLIGEPETRAKIIARWKRILADPHAIRIAKRMAKEALARLGE